MRNSRQVRIHESLINQFGLIAKPVAEKIKKEYKLSRLELSYPTISEIVAGKLSNKKSFNFRIRKIGRDKGIMEIV